MTMKTLLRVALFLPLAALAHAHLQKSVPAKGSTVGKSPAAVELVFSEPVGLVSLKLQRKGEATVRDLAPLPPDDAVVLLVPLPDLTEGEYVLNYVGQSADLHEVKGSIGFRVSADGKPARRPAQTAQPVPQSPAGHDHHGH